MTELSANLEIYNAVQAANTDLIQFLIHFESTTYYEKLVYLYKYLQIIQTTGN